LPVAVLLGAGDLGSSRLVYGMVIGLVVIGFVLVLLAVWILRQTRPDLEVLAPLERMGDSDWKKKDPSTQRRILDELRPDGAEPLIPASRPPSIDADFEQADHPVTSFSDLGPGVVAETRDPTPAHTDFEPFGLPVDIPVETPVVPSAEEQPEPEQPEVEPEPEPEPEVEPEQPEVEPEQPEVEPEPEPDQPEVEPEPEPEQSEVEPEPEVEVESVPESEPEAAAQAGESDTEAEQRPRG
jgi:hypothetical protein